MWVTECGGKHFVVRIHAERCKTLDSEKQPKRKSEENEFIELIAMRQIYSTLCIALTVKVEAD